MKRKLSLRDDPALQVDEGMKRADAAPTNTSSIRSNTVFPEGQHIEIAHRDILNFQFLGQLGHGASAMVEIVKDRMTGQKFAHKFFGKYYGSNFDEFKEAFKNEIDIIKQLQSHIHIVEVFGSYACGRELGMLLTPVANGGDLRAYLQDVKDTDTDLTENQYSVLNNSFGCLASGLGFIHRHTIRHKDIKPANILIHNDRVIFTDFGIALNASQQNTTTTGRPGAHTPRYCAPEVANHERRNRKSDVFSLGCVFLEVIAVLDPTIDLGVSNIDPYWKTVDRIQGALNDIITSNHERSQLFRAFCSMLEPETAYRIDAEALHDRLLNIQDSDPHLPYRLFCDDCAPKRDDKNKTAVIGQKDEKCVESDNAEKDRSLDASSIEGDFSPFRDEAFGSLSIRASIQKVLDRRFEQEELRWAYFRIRKLPGNPRFASIKKSHTRRALSLQNKCMHDAWVSEEYTEEKLLLSSSAQRVEQLVFAELKDIRFQINHCEECSGTHTELFRTTPEHIAKVVEKFSDWIKKYPYGFDAADHSWTETMTLSKDDIEHDMEMLCQPVPFEE